MPIRVIRLMEYTYPNAEAAVRDMERWQVQGTRVFAGTDRKIVSTVLPFEIFEEPAKTIPPSPTIDAVAFNSYNRKGQIGVALREAGARKPLGRYSSTGHLIGNTSKCPHPQCVQNRHLAGLL